MIKPLELYIGLRYTKARRHNHFISFISLMATLGIILGVMALITVLSVMNGFGNELRQRILGAVSHVTITAERGTLQDPQKIINATKGQPAVIGRAPYISAQGMLVSSLGSRGAMLRGIDPEAEKSVAVFHQKMIFGALSDLKSGEYGIIIGSEIAWRLGIDPDSYVTVLSSRTQITPFGMLPRSKRFRVVGIFELNMTDFDGALALLHIDDARRLHQIGSGVTGIRLMLDSLFMAPRVAEDLQKKLGPDYRVRDWTHENASFFRALRIEKTAMFIIMFLVVAVAAFNIVSMLVMLVTDKEGDIAILRTLGMSPDRVMMIFIIHGAILGIFGTLLGAISGVLLASNIDVVIRFFELIFQGQLFTEDIYYDTGLNADLQLGDVLTIVFASLLLTIAATIYPARQAALVDPAQALNHE